MWERPHVADIVFITIIIDFFEELKPLKKLTNRMYVLVTDNFYFG